MSIDYKKLKASIINACHDYLTGKATGFFSGSNGKVRVTKIKNKLENGLSDQDLVALLRDIFDPETDSPNFKRAVLKQLDLKNILPDEKNIERYSFEALANCIYTMLNNKLTKNPLEWVVDREQSNNFSLQKTRIIQLEIKTDDSNDLGTPLLSV